MANSNLPPIRAPIANKDGTTTNAFYKFFLSLAGGSDGPVGSLAKILKSLGSTDGTDNTIIDVASALEGKADAEIQILGAVSISGGGDLSHTRYLRLLNDVDAVGDTKYYGSDDTGRKGWYAISNAFADSSNIVQTVDGTGVTSFDLTDVTVTAGGTLQKLAFDAKGRLSEQDAATTDDLAEGATNLYFTDARAQDATGAAISAGTQTGITVTYNSGSHSIDFTVAPADFATKTPVAYAATAALPANTYSNGTAGVGATLTGTTNGPLVIDGVTLVTGSAGLRVLVTAEASSAHNGWYVVTQVGVIAVSPYILTRSTDADTGTEIGPGYLTVVEAPSALTPGTNNGKVFISVAPVPFVVGTDILLFSAVGAAGGVSSVFGRTGVVVAATGDYTVSQVTGAVASTRTIATTAPLTGGGDLSAGRTIAIPVATSSVNGYLDHADWTTFNGKLSDAPNDGNTYARNSAAWTEIAASIANTNGFMIGNVLVQTGSDSAPIPSSSHETSKAVTFPVPYGTCLYAHAIPTVRSVTSSGFSAVPSTLSKSGTGFTANFDSDSGGVAGAYINTIIYFDWIAVGIFVGYGTLALTGTYPAGTVGTPYSQTLAISGGLSPYTLTGGTGIASGSLPAGLSLSISGSTLVLSGTPTTAATSTFTVSVDSTDAQTATSPQSIDVSAAVSAYTLNPADKYSDLVLSGGNLIATRGSAGASWECVRGISFKSAGKLYFGAVTRNAGTSNGPLALGIADSSAGLTAYPGSDIHGWAHLSDGYKAHNGYSAYGNRWDTVGKGCICAWDAGAGNVWFGDLTGFFAGGNPSTGANPTFTGVFGTLAPILAVNSPVGVSLQSYFAGEAAIPATPSGFTLWTP